MIFFFRVAIKIIYIYIKKNKISALDIVESQYRDVVDFLKTSIFTSMINIFIFRFANP